MNNFSFEAVRNSSEFYSPSGTDDFLHHSSVVLTALNFLAVIMNVSIIRYSRKLRVLTGDLTHSFVCSMAVADLLLCCFAQPADFVIECLTSAKLVAMPHWICRIQHMINWLGYSASGISLTLLNLDKLIFFKWPLHYGSINAPKTALYSISASWLLCILGTITMIIPGTLDLSLGGTCDTESVSKPLYIFYTVAFCILPVLSSALVSAYLGRLVSKMRRTRKCSLGADITIQQRLRAMAYIFITTAWTFAALVPFRCFNLLRLEYQDLWQNDQRRFEVVAWIGYGFFFILALNPFVDSCLTLLTYAPYKNLAKIELAKMKKLVLFALPCVRLKDKIEWV